MPGLADLVVALLPPPCGFPPRCAESARQRPCPTVWRGRRLAPGAGKAASLQKIGCRDASRACRTMRKRCAPERTAPCNSMCSARGKQLSRKNRQRCPACLLPAPLPVPTRPNHVKQSRRIGYGGPAMTARLIARPGNRAGSTAFPWRPRAAPFMHSSCCTCGVERSTARRGAAATRAAVLRPQQKSGAPHTARRFDPCSSNLARAGSTGVALTRHRARASFSMAGSEGGHSGYD